MECARTEGELFLSIGLIAAIWLLCRRGLRHERWRRRRRRHDNDPRQRRVRRSPSLQLRGTMRFRTQRLRSRQRYRRRRHARRIRQTRNRRQWHRRHDLHRWPPSWLALRVGRCGDGSNQTLPACCRMSRPRALEACDARRAPNRADDAARDAAALRLVHPHVRRADAAA